MFFVQQSINNIVNLFNSKFYYFAINSKLKALLNYLIALLIIVNFPINFFLLIAARNSNIIQNYSNAKKTNNYIKRLFKK